MSKILVVGASGTIGCAVAYLLEQVNQVIRVGNRRGDYTVDLGSKGSILNINHFLQNCKKNKRQRYW